MDQRYVFGHHAASSAVGSVSEFPLGGFSLTEQMTAEFAGHDSHQSTVNNRRRFLSHEELTVCCEQITRGMELEFPAIRLAARPPPFGRER
jgi:hypothetical protein